MTRQRRARVGELPAHQHHQREAEEQEEQAGDGVLDTDDLVVDREHVRAPEAQYLVMDFVRAVRLRRGNNYCLAHAGWLSVYFAPGVVNLKFWGLVSLAATVTDAVCVPSFSCHAVIP